MHRAFAALAALLIPVGGAEAACRIALTLAMDISSSVNEAEDSLQRQGLAAALNAPAVRDAILAIPGQPVALSVLEWSGQVQQDVMLDWMLLDSPAAIDRAVAGIANSKRPYAEFSTAIGQMLRFADAHFARAPRCARQILDVSGDGVHNDGPPPSDAYGAGALANATVNALAIVVEEPAMDHATPFDLVAHYRAEVIHGPGAFVIRAWGFDEFEAAMRAKLLRELSVQIGARTPAPLPGGSRQ